MTYEDFTVLGSPLQINESPEQIKHSKFGSERRRSAERVLRNPSLEAQAERNEPRQISFASDTRRTRPGRSPSRATRLEDIFCLA
jgi:hypothetical protein